MSSRKRELGKWLLYKWFYQDVSLRSYLPPTRPLTTENLDIYLQRYRSIYLKPVAGSRGQNVMRIFTHKDGTYGLHRENERPRSFLTRSELHRAITELTRSRTWIVQRDVHLATIHDRPYDVRVMMQKDEHEQWQCTGICAKIAGPHSAVTNIARSHGRVVSLADALLQSHGYTAWKSSRMQQKLCKLGFNACKRLEAYQTYSEIGLDVGIDKTGKLWILEENTGPSHALFAHLADQRTYLHIQKVARARKIARHNHRVKKG